MYVIKHISPLSHLGKIINSIRGYFILMLLELTAWWFGSRFVNYREYCCQELPHVLSFSASLFFVNIHLSGQDF